MRSIFLAFLLALCGAAGASADAPSPGAALEHFDCHRDKVAINRAISITAVMHAKSGLPHLYLEFLLERKAFGLHRFRSVREGDLGKWLTPSDSTLGERPDDVWMLNKQVVNLAAPGIYRFEVRFRWSADGQPPAEETLLSARCAQTRG